MARTRHCRLCGVDVKITVAAHVCPHGNACRYLCGADGLPVDWASPECDQCREGATSIAKQLVLIRDEDAEDWPDDD